MNEGTFEQLDKQNQTSTPNSATNKEVVLTDFSDVAVGQKTKYTRPDLNGKQDVIDKFVIFTADTSKEPQVSRSKTSKYWVPTCTITYESKNEDGLNNREYISGAKVFAQQDGSVSDMQFWYKGGKTQLCLLWEKVAKHKKLAPDQLSPREFVAFLNGKPAVVIESVEYDNLSTRPGASKTVSKNMVGKFI